MVTAVLRVIAYPQEAGICDEIPFSQAKGVAELNVPEFSELVFPSLYRRGCSFPSRRLESLNLKNLNQFNSYKHGTFITSEAIQNSFTTKGIIEPRRTFIKMKKILS